jgi:hypothetical protein
MGPLTDPSSFHDRIKVDGLIIEVVIEQQQNQSLNSRHGEFLAIALF